MTGACLSVSVRVCVCVCVCVRVSGGGGQSSVIRGVREGGGQGREGVQLPDSLVDEAVFSLFVLAWRLLSLLPDGSRLKKLCVGWVGSPAMLRALRVRRVRRVL